MTLDGVTHQMIPRIIGKNGKTILKIKSDAWAMYKGYQRGVGGKNKTKLFIKIDKKDAGVFAEIVTDSDTMRKFAIQSLRTNVKAIVDKSRGNTFHLYSEMPHSCIGMLIGKGARLVRKDVEDLSYEITSDYEPKYGEFAQKTWAKVEKVSPESFTPEFLESIKLAETKSFVGWEPDSLDSEVVEILVVNQDLPKNVFLDLVNRLSEKLDNRIKRIVSRHQETMSWIDEALQFDDEYSPDSPR